jgi:hypothetical protein
MMNSYRYSSVQSFRAAARSGRSPRSEVTEKCQLLGKLCKLRINTTRPCSAPLTDLLSSVRTTQSSEHSASLAPQITVAVAAEHPPMPHGGLCNQTITARFAKALPQMGALM